MFTAKGALIGSRSAIPIALSIFAYGTVYGMLARQTGVTLIEVLSMSTFVFAGSAQLIILDLWKAPLPAMAIILTTLIVNLRHLLMGAALQPWFSQLSPSRKYISAFFMVDENWALSIREFQKGHSDAAFLLGSGLVCFLAWFVATAVGYTTGTFIQDPARWGLDFAFLAVFVALLAGMWRGKSDLLPWAVAALVAVITAECVPGKWYILLGGLAGSIFGATKDAS